MSTRRKASGPKRMAERVHWDEGLAKRLVRQDACMFSVSWTHLEGEDSLIECGIDTDG